MQDLFARFADQQTDPRHRTRSKPFLFQRAIESRIYVPNLSPLTLVPALFKPATQPHDTSTSTTGQPKAKTSRHNTASETDIQDKSVSSEKTKSMRHRTSETPERFRGQDPENTKEGNGEGHSHSKDAQSSLALTSDDENTDLEMRYSTPPPISTEDQSLGPVSPDNLLRDGSADIPTNEGQEDSKSALGDFYALPADFGEDDNDGGSFSDSNSNNLFDSSHDDIPQLPPFSNKTPRRLFLPQHNIANLPTIAEESLASPPVSIFSSSTESPLAMGSKVLVSRGAVSHKKRSLSTSDIFTPPPKRRFHELGSDNSQLPILMPAPSNTCAANVGLADLVDSMHRLEPGGLLNDFIINTMAHRLASKEVGIVDSFMIANRTRTSSARLKLQNTMSRNRVLIFVNHDFHWVLFLWKSVDGVLQEYNSLPGSRGVLSDSYKLVADFLRWVHNNSEMAIHLESPACPSQPNGYDCRVYSIRFAECLASGRAIPSVVDESLGRKCLRNALLVTWDAALHPSEISNIGCPVTQSHDDKAIQLQNYHSRKSHFQKLLAPAASIYATSTVSLTALRRIADHEDRAIQKSIQAGIIDSIHVSHLEALSSAIGAASKATTLLETSRGWKKIKAKMEDLLSSFAEMAAPGDVSALPEPDRARYRNVDIIKNAADNMSEHWDACQESSQGFAAAREVAKAHFLSTRVQLIILSYAVRSTRWDFARVSIAAKVHKEMILEIK
ncbi:putative Ulp1 protease family protein [Colletotrichum sublineola]|uniref:Putative Ulp1 protease family protein n=1 Tax=Colletotrichum sublineola TaxID=1173701 RepID=A0A066XDH6_COLSU|nr:putative Ulp1 protease family protein [Colletotrichum sublineola]